MCEMPEVYEKTERRARKLHSCCECCGIIKPPEVYIVHTGLWDGRWDQFKHCRVCNDLFNEIQDQCRNSHDDGVAFESLSEHVFESDNDDHIIRFVENRIARNTKPSRNNWMEERYKLVKQNLIDNLQADGAE